MTKDQAALFRETVGHFENLARANRFADNWEVPHDASRCAVCHPERVPVDPFAIYLEVVTHAVMLRRPALDDALVAVLNEDLALAGSSAGVTLSAILGGEEDALSAWRAWIFDALQTGLDLLSVHSPTAQEFSIEETEEDSKAQLV